MVDRKRPTPHTGNGGPGEGEQAFVERIAALLRSPERLDPSFDARVMEAVRAEAHAEHARRRRSETVRRGWLRRPRTLRISPLAGLAAAAGFGALVLLGAELLRSIAPGGVRGVPEARLPAADTVHLIRFVFLDPDARSVSLVGDFNGWTEGATPLERAGEEGVWTVSLPLPPGRHEYAFIASDAAGQRWVADPFAPVVRDEFDTESSVLLLGGSGGAAPPGAS